MKACLIGSIEFISRESTI